MEGKPVDQIPLMQRMALKRDAEMAVRRNPKNVDAILTVAGLLGAETDAIGAIGWLRKAQALRKKDPDILRRLVAAARDGKMFKQAISFARKLCDAEWQNGENHRALGQLLETSGFPKEAIQAYENAEKIEPNNASSLSSIGKCHSFLGDHETAAKYYRLALKADPHSATSLFGLSEVTKFNPDETKEFVNQANFIADGNEDEVAKSLAWFSAGKALDDAKQYDEAFSYFRRANDIRRPEAPPDYLRNFANLKAAFTRQFFAERPGFGSSSRKPIFVCGMPRSGTTLTESICGAHSQVTAGDEMSYLRSIVLALGADNSNADAFARSMRQIRKENSVEIANDYLNKTSIVAGNTPHFTDKLPHNFLYVGMIKFILPNAKVIHCRRHPLDTALSHYSNSMGLLHNTYKTDLARFGLYYRQYLALMRHWREVIPGFMHEVYYEDVVANTELNARAIIEYLGLNWEDGVMDRANSQRSVRTISVWQVRQPVYQSSKGKWRNYEKHLGPLIDALGPEIGIYEKELEALADQKAA